MTFEELRKAAAAEWLNEEPTASDCDHPRVAIERDPIVFFGTLLFRCQCLVCGMRFHGRPADGKETHTRDEPDGYTFTRKR